MRNKHAVCAPLVKNARYWFNKIDVDEIKKLAIGNISEEITEYASLDEALARHQ